ncbi:hypothetical protein ACFL0H_11010 [Thermodesulfobacteriota bacterium]
MEPAHKVKVLEQVEAGVEAVAVVAGEVVLRQARAVTASAPTVVKEQTLNGGLPAMSRNAQNAALP